MKLDSKYFDRIRVRRKGERPAEPSTPECQWDGCSKPGVHRAPVGRDAEGQYFLFCFEHARDYNKGYNYFSGLSDGEIARYQKGGADRAPANMENGRQPLGRKRADPIHRQIRIR